MSSQLWATEDGRYMVSKGHCPCRFDDKSNPEWGMTQGCRVWLAHAVLPATAPGTWACLVWHLPPASGCTLTSWTASPESEPDSEKTS